MQLVFVNGSDGVVEVEVFGGVFFYQFMWSSGGNVVVVIGLFVGKYIVIVMDVNGCVIIVEVIVGEDILFLLLVISQYVIIDCQGVVVGVFFVKVIGGKSFFIYVWSNGGVGENVNGLIVGVYILIVIDVIGIVVEAFFIIEELVVLKV